jgi:methanogenic corrinoid protein MtbC1
MSGYNISAVERDTGLSRDVLRMWERRYGFPTPERDGKGERVYSREQVERLRLIKRLMDQGHRPGRLIASSPDELAGLAPRRPPPVPVATTGEGIEELLTLLKTHETSVFHSALQSRLARAGLQRFVDETVAPLAQRVGEAWQEGEVEVFEEHLFTEVILRVLRQAIAGLPAGLRPPRILLTTPPEELHALGMLMAEALFALDGATCVSLGTQMPASDIQRAAMSHRADVVALSLSSAFPARQVGPLLKQLRELLPVEIELWVGGSGALRMPLPGGVLRLPTLDAASLALRQWRETHPDR